MPWKVLQLLNGEFVSIAWAIPELDCLRVLPLQPSNVPTRPVTPLLILRDQFVLRNSVGDHPGGVRKELMNLAVPAIVGQAIDPVAQLLETAYIGRLGKSISPRHQLRTGLSSWLDHFFSGCLNSTLHESK